MFFFSFRFSEDLAHAAFADEGGDIEMAESGTDFSRMVTGASSPSFYALAGNRAQLAIVSCVLLADRL